jgi:CBS domain-containing protein
MDPRLCHEILQMLRDARSLVYRDAESFDEAASVLEHIGQILAGAVRNGLGMYEGEILSLAGQAPGTNARHLRELFDTVRRARNDSVHSGDYVRHHVLRLVELLLILEEALSMNGKLACDLMVRNPVTAELWNNIATVRRAMLSNSFSYLPIQLTSKEWKLISDVSVVKYLNGFENRNAKLGQTLASLINAGTLIPIPCESIPATTPIREVIGSIQHQPVLILEHISDESRLIGILTAFDLL